MPQETNTSITKFHFKVPTNIEVEFRNADGSTRTESCTYLNAGCYNAAYRTGDKLFVPKAQLFDLVPQECERHYSETHKELAALARIMDDPERCCRLWNTQVLPRLRKRAQELNLPLDTTPELKPAEICYFILPAGKKIKAWVAPFLPNDNTPITNKDLQKLITELYSGDQKNGILGGRLMGDITVDGNVVCWRGALIPIDPGALFSISRENTLRREKSQASLDAWFAREKSNEQYNFFREDTFRGWFIGEMCKRPRSQSNLLLNSAICYLAAERPNYLDIGILNSNPDLRNACAFLFLSNNAKTVPIPLFASYTAETAQAIVNRFFPIIDAPYKKFEQELQSCYAKIQTQLATLCEQCDTEKTATPISITDTSSAAIKKLQHTLPEDVLRLATINLGSIFSSADRKSLSPVLQNILHEITLIQEGLQLRMEAGALNINTRLTP